MLSPRSNKNIFMSSVKSSRNIQKKEYGPDRSVSDNQSSSVTLNELAEKAIIIYCNFEFQQRSHTMTKFAKDYIYRASEQTQQTASYSL